MKNEGPEKPTVWAGQLPELAYHGTAAGRFDSFDLSRSNGCAWFTRGYEDAAANARSFARHLRGRGEAGVYVCRLRLSKVAQFDNEDAIYDFGDRFTASHDRNTILTAAAEGLRNEGFDGLVDLYNSSAVRLSIGVVIAERIQIIEYRLA